jgi:hypothetical protein
MILNTLVSCLRALNCRACTACVWVVFSVVGAAFGAGCGSLDRAANAIQMAEILYPELKGKEFQPPVLRRGDWSSQRSY